MKLIRIDLHTICYTSGTTGTPKGVMLTHKNLVAGISGFFARLPADSQLGVNDRHLSYLPASHMFERMILTGMAYSGGQIGFFRGEILKLFDDIALLRPTIFPSVPRLLSRLYDKVLAGVSASPVKKVLVLRFNLSVYV
jgi:long-chain acyl-CoA synthetase